MKVLFLDVDGVLNNDKTTERCLFYTGVDKTLAKLLTDWMKDKDVKIVLSSTWRRFPEMHFALKEEGIEWIDVTPHFPNRQRGEEIREWMMGKEVTAFAVLDDSNDMDAVRSNFVRTNPKVGLVAADLVKLNKHLGYD